MDCVARKCLISNDSPVDTVVAQHLLKTVTAARLMGAECIISGVRAQIAQTIVHLGINLMDVTTQATLSAAFSVALERLGITSVREAEALRTTWYFSDSADA